MADLAQKRNTDPVALASDTDGPASRTRVDDEDTQYLLASILVQLKIITYHLAAITDDQATSDDIDRD